MSAGPLMKKPRKGESGAQFLARLNSRADLSALDPDVFDKAATSLPSNSLKSFSSYAKIVELYGAEGVGKTEMVLHYVAKACLPSTWNGLSLNGLGTKVIFIDTEFKFSVLRLAIVMEKQILDVCERLKLRRSGCELVTPQNTTGSSIGARSGNKEVFAASDKLSTPQKNLRTPAEDSHTGLCQISLNAQTTDTCGGEIVGMIHGDCVSVADKGADSDLTCHRGSESESSQANVGQALTSQDIEDLVQEALGRVQVMHVTSTDQLLISLLSLEHSLSCDPLVSLVAIDTISAYFWLDKLGDSEKSCTTNLKMAPIAGIISKYVSEFGISFLITKSALINNARKWNATREEMKIEYNSANSGNPQSFSRLTDGNEMASNHHVEFLGKSWVSLRKKRLVLTRTVNQMGRVERSAWCTDWPVCKQFICTDEGLHFV